MCSNYCVRCGTPLDLVSMVRWALAIRAHRREPACAKEPGRFAFRCPGCELAFEFPVDVALEVA
jgi:hypothetical protein